MPEKPKIAIEVHLTPAELDEIQLKDKNVVVIDVLRSATTIATALQNGAKEIIPVGDIESAVKISGSLFGEVILRGGERNGKMIEGFNLGNSPAEYTEPAVKGKSIIFMTSNGTAAMVKGRYAKNLVVAGFINLSTVVDFLCTVGQDVLIVCAGKENKFCVEDAVCAGKIVSKLSREFEDSVDIDDGAKAAVALDQTFGKSILKMLKEADHGRYLTEIGFSEDLKLCSQVDSVPVLPLLSGNIIKLPKETPQTPRR